MYKLLLRVYKTKRTYTYHQIINKYMLKNMSDLFKNSMLLLVFFIDELCLDLIMSDVCSTAESEDFK